MQEELISKLDSLGVQYNEDPESGSITVDVAALDKTQLIEVIQVANDAGLPFTVDEMQLVISVGPTEATPMPEEMPMDGDYQAMALEQMPQE